MKEIVTLSFNGGIEFNRKALLLIKRDPDKQKLKGLGTQNLILDKTSSEYSVMTELLCREEVRHSEFWREEYEPNEIVDESLFWVFIGDYWGNPEPLNGFEAEVYDESTACRHCGNGAVQKGSYRIKAGKLPKPHKRPWMVLGMANADIVSDELAETFRKHRLSGWHLQPVLNHSTGKPVVGWNQFKIDSILPQVSASTNFLLVSVFYGSEMKHPNCHHIGRDVPDRLVYAISAVRNTHDFNLTAEYLGGGLRTFRQRIVSGRALRLLKQLHLQPLFIRKATIEQ